MYTEDEARDKNCCNSTANYPHQRDCVAKRCMAWRVCRDERDREIKYTDGLTHGYCGLAGKP